jgi:hypothetical protein
MSGLNPSTAPWQATQGATALATDTLTAIKAAAAGYRHCLTGLQIWNASATVDTVITIVDGASTVVWAGYLPNVTDASPIVPTIVAFDPPIIGTVGSALGIKAVTTGAAIYWNAQGFDV